MADIKTDFKNWQVVVGCELMTEACDSCPSYIESRVGLGVEGHIFESGYDVRVIEAEFNTPLKNPIPSNYQVALGSDIFHESVKERDLKKIFSIMNLADRHTFTVGTKRAERMAIASARYDLSWSENIIACLAIEAESYAWKIDYLRQTPARTRVLSLSPLLSKMGVLDLYKIDAVHVAQETWGLKRKFDQRWADDVAEQCKEQNVKYSEEINVWEVD